LSPWRAILFSAVLFGLFHVIVRDRLLFERLISSTMMGVALGWVCLRTGSILPGMLLHVLNNGFFMLLAEYQTELADLGIGNQQQSMLPWHYLVIAAIVAATGIVLVNVSSRPVTDSDIITTAAASPVQ
jgi:sodium transport system permease protein